MTAPVARTRVRAREETRACHPETSPGRKQFNQPYIVVLVSLLEQVTKSRKPAFTETETVLACWPWYFRQKITGLIETASTKYCLSIREKAEIGGSG
jgi:hypothetical protein